MKNLIKRSHFALYILLCVCFFSCKNMKKEFTEHQNRIKEIKVVTIEGDTVLIKSHGTGHMEILPIKFSQEK
jgi:hypothetical protein